MRPHELPWGPISGAQVGAPDLDLAILSGLEIRRVSCTGLQLRRRIAGEWRDCPDQSGQSGQSITNQGNQSASFTFKEGFTNLDLDSSPSETERLRLVLQIWT